MSDDDVRRRLEDAGRAPAPAPDPRFADDLESRLRTQMATGGRTRRRRASVARLPVPAAFAVAAVVLVAALAAGLLVDREPVALTLVSAVDTEVVQPDGEVMPGRPGLELRDGAVVRTGPTGRALVGEVDLGPGATALIVDGAVRRIGSPAGVDRTTTTVAPAVTLPPDTVAPTVPPLPTSTTTAATAPPDRTTTTAAPRQDAPAARLHLVVRAGADGRVGLAWTAYEGPDFYAYLVVRAEGSEPSYPPAEGDRVVFVARDRDATRAFDRAASHDRPVYRVVAVDREGTERARSDAVSPLSGR